MDDFSVNNYILKDYEDFQRFRVAKKQSQSKPISLKQV
jgi:hypothetical protein